MKSISSRRLLLAVRVLLAAAILATMVFIFSNSLAVADVSNSVSGDAQQQLYTLLDKASLPGLKQVFSIYVVRKLAHFSEYALLGFWWGLLAGSFAGRLRRYASAALACAATAFADEGLQLITPGRSGQLSDVALDCCGALAGILTGVVLLCIARRLYRRYHRKKE